LVLSAATSPIAPCRFPTRPQIGGGMSAAPDRALKTLRAAPAAYRADLAGADDSQMPPGVGGWVAVTSILCHAAENFDDAHRTAGLAHAAGLLRTMIAEDVLAAGCRLDHPEAHPSDSAGVRFLAEQLEDAGALHLAALTLDALDALDVCTPVEQGRLIAQRASRWARGRSVSPSI